MPLIINEILNIYNLKSTLLGGGEEALVLLFWDFFFLTVVGMKDGKEFLV
jgi:hypothetical protein